MSQEKVTVDREGRILLIGLNRPEKRNAFDLDMYWGLARALGQLHNDPELWCGVLYAHGDHFTSGLDMVQWAQIFAAGEYPQIPDDCLDPFGLDESKRCSKPLVFAAQGICYTVGWELMMTTDVRIVASNLRLAQLEVKRGIYPVGGATVRHFQEIGWGNAMRYLLTGDEMTAQEAYRLGLVQEVVEPGQQLDRAVEIAQRICKAAPLGVQAILRSARIAQREGAQAAFDRLLPDLVPISQSEDAIEGVQSFIERREANFKGR